jgi:hypothetical protein
MPIAAMMNCRQSGRSPSTGLTGNRNASQDRDERILTAFNVMTDLGREAKEGIL